MLVNDIEFLGDDTCVATLEGGFLYLSVTQRKSYHKHILKEHFLLEVAEADVNFIDIFYHKESVTLFELLELKEKYLKKYRIVSVSYDDLDELLHACIKHKSKILSWYNNAYSLFNYNEYVTINRSDMSDDLKRGLAPFIKLNLITVVDNPEICTVVLYIEKQLYFIQLRQSIEILTNFRLDITSMDLKIYRPGSLYIKHHDKVDTTKHIVHADEFTFYSYTIYSFILNKIVEDYKNGLFETEPVKKALKNLELFLKFKAKIENCLATEEFKYITDYLSSFRVGTYKLNSTLFEIMLDNEETFVARVEGEMEDEIIPLDETSIKTFFKKLKKDQ